MNSYILPPLPELPAKDMAGPFPWCNWVIGRQVLAGAFPSTWDDAETEDILRTFLELKISTFVCLQAEFTLDVPEKSWRSGVGLRPYIKDATALLNSNPADEGSRIKQKKLDFLHLPILDGSVTTDAAMERLTEDVHSRVLQGQGIYIHCWGGHGRTGVLVALLLSSLYGLTAKVALEYTQAIHDARGNPQSVRSPQTRIQRDQVRRIISHCAQDLVLAGLGKTTGTSILSRPASGPSLRSQIVGQQQLTALQSPDLKSSSSWLESQWSLKQDKRASHHRSNEAAGYNSLDADSGYRSQPLPERRLPASFQRKRTPASYQTTLAQSRTKVLPSQLQPLPHWLPVRKLSQTSPAALDAERLTSAGDLIKAARANTPLLTAQQLKKEHSQRRAHTATSASAGSSSLAPALQSDRSLPALLKAAQIGSADTASATSKLSLPMRTLSASQRSSGAGFSTLLRSPAVPEQSDRREASAIRSISASSAGGNRTTPPPTIERASIGKPQGRLGSSSQSFPAGAADLHRQGSTSKQKPWIPATGTASRDNKGWAGTLQQHPSLPSMSTVQGIRLGGASRPGSGRPTLRSRNDRGSITLALQQSFSAARRMSGSSSRPGSAALRKSELPGQAADVRLQPSFDC